MSISIHTNLMATHAARNLNASYSRLEKAVQHLSSGLRINSAADDAAGLAIREMMRSDITTLNQGIRNANDAISLIQTADGALSVIDEKLIRMKELAEQASTGTYNSTQRLIINSEFKAMGMEIDRIAHSTDFNGIHLLDGTLSGEHNGSGLTSTGAVKIHFGTGNNSAEDYYYLNIADCTLMGLGLGVGEFVDSYDPGELPDSGSKWWHDSTVKIDLQNKTVEQNIVSRIAGDGTSPAGIKGMKGHDYYDIPEGLLDVIITSNAAVRTPPHKSHVCLFTKDGHQLTGPIMPTQATDEWTVISNPNGSTTQGIANIWWNGIESQIIPILQNRGILDPNATLDTTNHIQNTGDTITIDGMTITIVKGQNEIMPTEEEIINIDKTTSDFVFIIGGHANNTCNNYRLNIKATMSDGFIKEHLQIVPIKIKGQEGAQKALEILDDAMVKKDKVRAYLGAMQNRLENTATNLAIQADNLQAAESRISDADVSTEMTRFVRDQILTQTGVAVLAQANSLPQILSSLLVQ